MTEMVPKTAAISESTLLGDKSFTIDSNKSPTSEKTPLLMPSSTQVSQRNFGVVYSVKIWISYSFTNLFIFLMVKI